jgi:hypothetical protein
MAVALLIVPVIMLLKHDWGARHHVCTYTTKSRLAGAVTLWEVSVQMPDAQGSTSAMLWYGPQQCLFE